MEIFWKFNINWLIINFFKVGRLRQNILPQDLFKVIRKCLQEPIVFSWVCLCVRSKTKLLSLLVKGKIYFLVNRYRKSFLDGKSIGRSPFVGESKCRLICLAATGDFSETQNAVEYYYNIYNLLLRSRESNQRSEDWILE